MLPNYVHYYCILPELNARLLELNGRYGRSNVGLGRVEVAWSMGKKYFGRLWIRERPMIRSIDRSARHVADESVELEENC